MRNRGRRGRTASRQRRRKDELSDRTNERTVNSGLVGDAKGRALIPSCSRRTATEEKSNQWNFRQSEKMKAYEREKKLMINIGASLKRHRQTATTMTFSLFSFSFSPLFIVYHRLFNRQVEFRTSLSVIVFPSSCDAGR